MGNCTSKSSKAAGRGTGHNSARKKCGRSQHLACGSGNNHTTTKVSIEFSPQEVAVSQVKKNKDILIAPDAAKSEPVKPVPIGWRDANEIAEENRLPYPLEDTMPQPKLVPKRPDAPPPYPPPSFLDTQNASVQQNDKAPIREHAAFEQAKPPPIGWNVVTTPPYPLKDHFPKPELPSKKKKPLPYPLIDHFSKPK